MEPNLLGAASMVLAWLVIEGVAGLLVYFLSREWI